jgi:hypothetical protein
VAFVVKPVFLPQRRFPLDNSNSMNCSTFVQSSEYPKLYIVSQEKRSIFWDEIVSVIPRKNIYVHVSYSERFPR